MPRKYFFLPQNLFYRRKLGCYRWFHPETKNRILGFVYLLNICLIYGCQVTSWAISAYTPFGFQWFGVSSGTMLQCSVTPALESVGSRFRSLLSHPLGSMTWKGPVAFSITEFQLLICKIWIKLPILCG